MMKNKSKKRKITVLVVMLILLSTVFTGFDSAFANVRNVDIIKIYACGILTGVLILTVKDIIRERKEG